MNLKAEILDEKGIKRSLTRIAHEIIEKIRGRRYYSCRYKKKRVPFS